MQASFIYQLLCGHIREVISAGLRHIPADLWTYSEMICAGLRLIPAVLWTYSEVVSAGLCHVAAVLWTYSDSLRTIILYFISVYTKVKVNPSGRKRRRITLLTQTAYGDTCTRGFHSAGI
jgi:hypothetical protein